MENENIRPNNYLVVSILSTIFCCWPVGIPAIVYDSQVNSKFANGDFEDAKRASESAKRWSLWSTIVFIFILFIYFAFFGFAIFTLNS